MKITYYSTSSHYRELELSKALEGRNFSTFELAIKAVKENYRPFENAYLSLTLDETEIYGEVKVQVLTGHRKARGKSEQIPIYKEETQTQVVKDYSGYQLSKKDFQSRNNQYGWQSSSHKSEKGYHIFKLGEIEESIDKERSLIEWKSNILIQFWDAERKYSPEVKEAGKPYSPASYEIINEKAVSEWLEVYWTPAGNYHSRNKFYLDKISCDRYDVCKQYALTDSLHISKVELEIED